MKEIFAVINQKGGVGKSTTAEAIGSFLTMNGYKVLYIDLDAQGNLTHTLCSSCSALSILDVLILTNTAKESIQRTEQGDIIVSSPNLSGADTVITTIGKEYRLKEALSHLMNFYDYIVIDTPPSLGILTINALTACTGIVIPAQADIYSLHGIDQLYTTIDTVKKYCNPFLRIKGILLTRYSSRSIISREVAEMIDKTAIQLQTKLYTTKIRECSAIREAQVMKKSIFTYAPKSNATMDYNQFIKELIEEE